MGTRTRLRLNHEQRILNSGARLHGAETTPLGVKQHIPLHLYCYSHARGSALHGNMHCGAMADAARCADRCSALRKPMQRTAFFATIRPSFRPTPFHQSKDCSPLSYEMPNKLCTRPIRTPLIPHSETSGRTARRPIEHNARPTPVRSEIFVYMFLIIAKRNPQKHREQLVFPANCLTLQERRGETAPRVHEKQPGRTPQQA